VRRCGISDLVKYLRAASARRVPCVLPLIIPWSLVLPRCFIIIIFFLHYRAFDYCYRSAGLTIVAIIIAIEVAMVIWIIYCDNHCWNFSHYFCLRKVCVSSSSFFIIIVLPVTINLVGSSTHIIAVPTFCI
jgi:hypothetical protein